ncbi:hypothetical protein S14_66 [Shewanella sp. phage 1/4]|uniref:hypothetical protein n=1 Tax=Shewanella phage 1/4 TaxID=1458859 RepID=UPI0004F90C44|nr:hypothetical protein S14_66 [Shewanella sp. phage 1/4]AHK11178.1 hypothetical protein S14_66 [Shewanella sp. phage 1/4]
MKKQSEWMRGLLAAEDMVLLHGTDYTRGVMRDLILLDYDDLLVEFHRGMYDYLDNYKERNNA